jgi:hypothetical protein
VFTTLWLRARAEWRRRWPWMIALTLLIGRAARLSPAIVLRNE